MPDKYAKMIPFFGNNVDDRVKLYLDALYSKWEADKPLTLSDQEQLRNKYFLNRDASSGDDAVHSEWGQFAADLKDRLSKAFTADALNVVKSLAGVMTPTKNLDNFYRNVVQEHADIMNAAGTPITSNPTMWSTAATISYRAPTPGSNLEWMENWSRGYAPRSDITSFGYKVDVYFIKKLMEMAAVKDTTSVSGFWASSPGAETEIIFRKHSDPSKLFKLTKDGNEVDVSASSVSSASTLPKCGTTGVKASGSLTCNDYLNKCLLDGKPENIAECKRFMADENFWDVTPQEVSNMLPIVAVTTLKNFGFKTYRNDRGHEVMQSVSEWLEGLKGKVTDAELEGIGKNPKLTIYLGLIVNKINNNPTILNSTIVGNPLNIDIDDIKASFRGTYGSMIGLVPGINKSKINEVNINLARQSDAIRMGLYHLRRSSENRMVLINGALYSMGIPYVVGVRQQMGGAGNVVTMYSTPTPENDLPVENAPVLRNLSAALLAKLKSMGKNLGSADQAELERYLADYSRTEEKLMKAIKYVDKYIDLIEVYKQYDRDNVLTVDNLVKFVDARTKYFDRTESKLMTVVDLLRNTFDQALSKADQGREFATPSLANM
jgi:hypothetical protein